jgi:hypothetical protein
MKRISFLFSILAVGPLTAFVGTKYNSDRNGKGLKVRAGEGRIHGHIKLKGVNANMLDVTA